MTSLADDILIFDGDCDLCTRSVAFILAHERAPAIRFAILQSTAAREVLRPFALDPDRLSTFILIRDDQAYVRSDALVEVARHLRMPWRGLRWLRVIPRRLRDALYDFVAGHRYEWFGKREHCMVPSAELRSRFLEDG